METLYWITALAALVGVLLNIRKHVSCFFIWSATNATWTVVDYLHGIHAQAALQFVYLLLSVYGIYKWRGKSWRKREPQGAEDADEE